MRAATAIAMVLLLAGGCPGPEPGDLRVSILAVEPSEVARGSMGALVSWEARGGGEAVYYSIVVGPEEAAVASGRAAPGVVQSDTIEAGSLQPCANRLILRAVSSSGSADQDSAELYLCPTERCGGCTGVVDGDADSDVDTDVDADSDADDCATRAFPNGGDCDPVTSDCCPTTESCEPLMDGTFVETCRLRSGTGGMGASCGGDDGFCRRGLTCISVCTSSCVWQCTNYCRLARGDADCAPDGACSTIGTSFGDMRSYGACVYP